MTAKILALDIECAPMTVHSWGIRDQNIGLNQILEDPRIMGFAAKWRGGKSTSWWSEYHHDRRAMLQAAHDLLDEADIVVHFNGTSFDMKWFNAEFIKEGISRPSPYKNIDLYRVVRSHLRLPSNKLAYVSHWLGIGSKVETGGHQLWVDCLLGDEDTKRKAWAKMRKYCKQDVVLLDPLFDALQAYFPAAINLAVYEEDDGEFRCQKCGKSEHLQSRGYAATAQRVYPQWHCYPPTGGCGGWTRETKAARSINSAGVV